MKLTARNNSGFTLTEILVVVAMIGIAMVAIMSMYILNMKSAYKQDATLEMQQNLRMAMESISNTLIVAGTLIPTNLATATTPTAITAGVLGSYSSSITINTSSADGVYARVTNAKLKNSSVSVNYSTSVDSVAGFTAGDRVRLIRPKNRNLYEGYTSLFVSSGVPAGQKLILVKNTKYDVYKGDMLAKATAPGMYDSIQYSLVTGGSSCPANQSCLARSINGTVEIIASYISKLRFSYVYDDNSEDKAPSTTNIKTVRAVRVTLDGTVTSNNVTTNKELVSLIMLRNK